jgi:hypothetical protein
MLGETLGLDQGSDGQSEAVFSSSIQSAATGN